MNQFEKTIRELPKTVEQMKYYPANSIDVTITTTRGEKVLSISGSLSQGETLIKELNLRYNLKENCDEEISKATKIWMLATNLSVELEIDSMNEFLSCVRLIKCRYDEFHENQNYFEEYLGEIKKLLNEYEIAGYDTNKVRFPNALSAVSHFVKHGKKLKCTSLEEYVEKAQDGFGINLTEETHESSGAICTIYKRGNFLQGYRKGVYYIKNDFVEIATFYKETFSSLNKLWPFIFLWIAFGFVYQSSIGIKGSWLITLFVALFIYYFFKKRTY